MNHRLPRWTPAAIMMIAGSSQSLGASPFAAAFELSSLNGLNGFVIHGISTGDRSGFSVSTAGDINGDGISDIIIGARDAKPNNIRNSGQCYVIFGKDGIGASGTIEASQLNGTNGFVCNGIAEHDMSGLSVSLAGDVNADGYGDIIIGASGAQGGQPAPSRGSGETYIIFGGLNVGSSGVIELSALDGATGFVCNGIDPGDASGASVSSAGDFNADGIDDFAIGAPLADPNGAISGESYIVFGAEDIGSTGIFELASLDSTSGVICNGSNSIDNSGISVSHAGDVNGDGADDIIIGANYAGPDIYYLGESYVVFGSPDNDLPGTIELAELNDKDGFSCIGVDTNDQSGRSVSSAGDINCDGFDDIIIGARFADSYKYESGDCYVVFGSAEVGSDGPVRLSNLDGRTGFTCKGINEDDLCGISVSSAGDINGDTIEDLIIGAVGADPNGRGSGESYVIFGSERVGISGSLDLSKFKGLDGFVCNGAESYSTSGYAVSGCGDINNDGIDDLMIGAYGADPNGGSSGETYVVFGRCVINGDMDDNDTVDTKDLGILIAQFGTPGPAADLNNDNVVDTADLGILIGAFGSTCP